MSISTASPNRRRGAGFIMGTAWLSQGQCSAEGGHGLGRPCRRAGGTGGTVQQRMGEEHLSPALPLALLPKRVGKQIRYGIREAGNNVLPVERAVLAKQGDRSSQHPVMPDVDMPTLRPDDPHEA